MLTNGLHWGKNSLETAYARGLAIDPYEPDEILLRNQRKYLNLGDQTYLHSNHLPPNSTWWYGDWHADNAGIRVQRNMSGGVYEILAEPATQDNVLTIRGRYTAVPATQVDNYGAWVPPEWGMVAQGTVDVNAQPQYEASAPWWDFGGYGGGFEDYYGGM